MVEVTAEKSAEKKQDIAKAETDRSLSPFTEMESWLESMLPVSMRRLWEWPSPQLLEGIPSMISPKVNVVERDDEILVQAELAGVPKDNLEINVSQNSVSISGKTESENKQEKGRYYRCEISRGAFSRTVSLPSDVDPDQANARFENGMLTITAPKTQATRKRQIKVE